MRKYMTKEVTSTVIEIATVGMDTNGLPTVTKLDPLVVLGSITKDKAQKLVSKQYPMGTTIYNMDEVTNTYKMKVVDFIKIAELVTDNDSSLEEEEEETEEESTDATE